jgi:hypothetical protein
MYIIVNHNIADPDGFWSMVPEKASNIPSHLKLHGVYPSKNNLRCICLWEAESPEAVNQFLRDSFGELSKDELFEINAEAAIGLPAAMATAN